MKPELCNLKHPIAIRTEHVASRATTLRVKQHDGQVSGANFTITTDTDNNAESDQQPETLFTVDGKLLTMDQRRTFRNASGEPLFDAYRRTSGYTWFVDLPGQGHGMPVVRLSPRWNNLKDKVHVEVLNAAAGGEEIRLEAIGQDVWKLRTNVYLADKVVMTAKRSDKLSPYLMWKRPEWIVEVAEGMDLSLVSSSIVAKAVSVLIARSRHQQSWWF